MIDIVILVVATATFIASCAAVMMASRAIAEVRQTQKAQAQEYSLVVKLQGLLKNKSATNAVAEHAEMIYQDLLQSLIPVMAAIDVMPRQTSEHPLWRALGGIMDEYARNPFTLEKLRRAIKLNSEVARSIEKYVARADRLLAHLSANEPDGILSATFTDGLLGQSLTFFAQARGLAARDDKTGRDVDII